MTKECLMCGRKFESESSTNFCSSVCKYDFVDAQLRSRPFKQKCKECGKAFFKATKSPFCSDECRQISIRKDMEKERLNKRLDSLDRKLSYCKRMGITYAEFQKLQTINSIKKEGIDGE